MTADRWQQIKTLFYAASERAGAERAAFLDAACLDDETLRHEVESLLATDEQAGSFLKRPVLAAETPATEVAVTQAELEAGQMIGHYQIERRLGAGGMGVVYLARDTELGRPAALKLLQASLTQDAVRVRRFKQEARAASALNHPNILTIYEVGQADLTSNGEHFIAAEFVDGRTLREQCSAGGLALGAALDLLIQVASALATAHEAGIVHRDIKPENIMLRKDGLVKVLDFGLAKLTEQATRPPSMNLPRVTTQPGVVMGTVSYMSPEQARGLDVDGRSDLFSLGVVMYELLTGCAPFAGETTSDVLVALLSGEPRPLTRYVTELPAALQQIVNSALAKPVEERYQTARELCDDLRRLKEELEFAAKLKGQSGSRDDILTLTVGAAIDAAQQTTFATRQVAEQMTFATRQVETTGSGFTALRDWLARRGKSLALAALVLVVLAAVHWQWFVPRGAAIDSLAVLPFTNVGNDPQMEYLPDGITESLINSLAQLPALRQVMSRSVVFGYKGKTVDPRQVGAALKVRAVVTGQVQHQGERLIISVELVDTDTGAQLWGDQYQRPFADLLVVQDTIAREITEALRLRLSGDEQRQLSKRYTQSTEAYQLFLIGRYHWNKRSAEGMHKSLEYFRQAIAKDPNYALAYVGIADAYATLGSYHLMPPKETGPAGRAAAEQALAIDPDLAEAHASLGKLYAEYFWDAERAEREFQRAIALKPNYGNAHHWYSTLLATHLGRFDEGVREARRALELDQYSPVVSTQLGSVLYRARRYDEAIAALRQTLDLEPKAVAPRYYLGICYLTQGQLSQAQAEFRQGHTLAPEVGDFIGLLGYTAGLSGQAAEARRYQAELNDLAQRKYASPFSHMILHKGLGELEQVFKWLEIACEERDPYVRGLKTDPLLDDLRTDARFAAILRRAGFTP